MRNRDAIDEEDILVQRAAYGASCRGVREEVGVTCGERRPSRGGRPQRAAHHALRRT